MLTPEILLNFQRNIQTQFQNQLLAYNMQQIYQNRIANILSQISEQNGESNKSESDLKSNSRLENRLDGNRPSIYNRRISSEQLELPDGKICTRVPARRWSKVFIIFLTYYILLKKNTKNRINCGIFFDEQF